MTELTAFDWSPDQITPYRRYYVPVKARIKARYSVGIEISIPEPDGELMVTLVDQHGHSIGDAYFDWDELKRAVNRVRRKYNRLPEWQRHQPTRPPANHAPTEGSHP